MSKKAYTTSELTGKRVIDRAKDKRIGKVRAFVFHPTERRVLGFTVKRPDAALMFHRKDAFVPFGTFVYEEGEIFAEKSVLTADRSAGKALDVDWDKCVIWIGMPLVTESGSSLGFVASVRFDAETGEVISLTTDTGLAKDTLLGRRIVPVRLIRGFKRGKHAKLSNEYADRYNLEPDEFGAIMVLDEALDIPPDGGAAEAAGKATAVVVDKAKKGTEAVKNAAEKKLDEAKPTLQKVASRTEKAVDNGAYAVGKQLGKASGMFSAFKEEFKKAAADDDDTN